MLVNSRRIISLFVILMLIFMGASVLVVNAGKPPGKTNQGNGNGIGIQRHVDIAKDADGNLHMVWQEPVDGQYEIFYGSKKIGKEMGIGTDSNPALRVTDTPRDSVWPKIAIDPVTDIIYVAWEEPVPSVFPDSALDPLPTPSLFYTAYIPPEDNDNQAGWTPAQNFADGSEKVQRFSVYESEYTLQASSGIESAKKGTFDSDRDGFKDSVEVLGVQGYATSWFKEDSDGDTLTDRLEVVYGFNPLINEYYTTRVKELISILWALNDDDGDGLFRYEETAGDWDVTMALASIKDDGYVTYTFFPMDDYSAYLTLELQVRRISIFPNPTPVNRSYSVTATVNPGTEAAEVFTQSGIAMEWEWFELSFGPFGVDADTATDVLVEVDFSTKSLEKSITIIDESDTTPWIDYNKMGIRSAMIAAPAPDYDQFCYMEGGNFDADNSDDATLLLRDMEIASDPYRPDLFLEIDYLVGHASAAEVYYETVNAYSDAGIILHYKLDEKNIPLDTETSPDVDDDGAETVRDSDEFRDLLHRHRNPDYDKYIHFMMAHKIYITDYGWVYGGAKSADTAEDLTHCGILIADQELMDENTGFSSLSEKRIKVFVHEIGHALNAAHEKDTGTWDDRVDGAGGWDTFNDYNVMRQNALHDARADELIRGDGNADNRDLGSTELIGMPRFSVESLDQIDLKNKLSVDTGRVIDLLGDYV